MSLFEPIKTKSSVLDFVTSNFNKASKNQNSYFDKFVKYYELYRGVQTNKNYKGRADLFIPEPYSNIETVHARVIRSFAGIKVIAQGQEDLETSESAENLLDWQTRVYNFKQAFKDADKDRHIYGTAILKVGWKFSEKVDRPFIEVVDPANYFFDP